MSRRAIIVAVTVVALATTVIALVLLSSPTPTPARLAHYAVSADDRQLTVTVALTRIETIVSSEIEESPSTVKVIILVTRRQAVVPANITFVDRTFTLSAALGSRRVVDANANAVAPSSQ